ncbi:MAG: mechanosensitive ion channel protein MscS [Oleiphilus sp.]|nr:MAG: mechanosensitive ion channel protein MscS [Oleiphilus sp.]
MENLNQNIEQSNEQLQELLQTAYTMVMTYGPKLVLAIITLIIGLWLINKVVRGLNTNLTTKVDATLGQFGSSVVSVILKAVLLISVASMIGIETTSFIAVLGAAGLAIGLALQGSLANFAGGVLILLFKPFKVGDLLEAQGYIATVKEIQIFNTILKTADNRIVIIPNGALSSSSMVNINQEDTRRVDFVFGIGYDDDIDMAKSLLNELIIKDERILKDPASMVVLSELADSSVNFTVRVWVNTPDYWGVYFDMHENVKKEFDAKGLSIPYPQQDVHLHKVA